MTDLSKIVTELKKKKQPAQRSSAWFEARWNRLTASDIATALTVTENDIEKSQKGIFHIKKPKTGRGCNPYQNKKSLYLKKYSKDADKQWKGNIYTRWGSKYEEVATMIYEKRNNKKVHEFGLLLHDTIPFIGASPDGICDDGCMLEIKCPYTREITGVVPHYYWTQMQTQLEVCNLEVCDFLECKFYEYKDMDEYVNDSPEFEKGAIIEYLEDINKKCEYIYVPVGTPDEVTEWINEWSAKQVLLDPYAWAFGEKTAEIIWWRLEQLSCVPVKRDRKWWAESLPQLQQVWDKIGYYRENGIEELETKKRKPKQGSGRTVDIYLKPKYNMLTDSESDSD